jgi:hypothetical protein
MFNLWHFRLEIDDTTLSVWIVNIELRAERQLGHISSIDNIGRFVMYVGGNWSPRGNLRCQRESPTLSHEEWV